MRAAGDLAREKKLSLVSGLHSRYHPGYAETDFDLRTKTFIFWMIDDDKDNRISLQEWFDNELGQFQLGDRNHDGVLTEEEAAGLAKIEEKLFSDLAVK